MRACGLGGDDRVHRRDVEIENGSIRPWPAIECSLPPKLRGQKGSAAGATSLRLTTSVCCVDLTAWRATGVLHAGEADRRLPTAGQPGGRLLARRTRPPMNADVSEVEHNPCATSTETDEVHGIHPTRSICPRPKSNSRRRRRERNRNRVRARLLDARTGQGDQT